VDTSQAPHLANFGYEVKRVLKKWYPEITNLLASPNYIAPSIIRIKFDPTYDGVAYASGNQIVGSVKYYEEHPDDIGSMIHELTHVIQQYRNCPSWLTEGIADWIRYYKYEPDTRLQKPNSQNNYTNGYGVSAYFLQYIIDAERFTPHMIYWANKDCREGTYKDSMWTRMTGKSVDQHWNDMIESRNV